MSETEPPMKIDPKKLYRVYFTKNENGRATDLKITGYVRFIAEPAGWGVCVDQPGDTEQYFPPGSYNRVAEAFDGDVR